ncbi:MAG: hypothetical protein JNM82_06730 [Rhodocyclaceae bacterium]|nr:hypothetical protein [Rhodocyclaceae bacterium]
MPVKVEGRDAAGRAVCAALRAQAARLGVDLGGAPEWPVAEWRRQEDPYSRQETLVGIWRDGHRYGELRFLPDGRVFAEYQVLLPHPGRAGLLVEAVSVWGDPQALKGDPVLSEWPPA